LHAAAQIDRLLSNYANNVFRITGRLFAYTSLLYRAYTLRVNVNMNVNSQAIETKSSTIAEIPRDAASV